MLSLFRALIGDFDVEAMIKVDQLVGPLLFISFIILGSLFLLNVFIAILSEAYEKAKIQVFGDAFDEHDEFWSVLYSNAPPLQILHSSSLANARTCARTYTHTCTHTRVRVQCCLQRLGGALRRLRCRKGAPTFNDYFNEYIAGRLSTWLSKHGSCKKTKVNPVRITGMTRASI